MGFRILFVSFFFIFSLDGEKIWKLLENKLLHNASHFQVSSRCLEMSPNGPPCAHCPKISSDGQGVVFFIFFRSLLGEIYLDNS